MLNKESAIPVEISQNPLMKTGVRNSYYSAPLSSLDNRVSSVNYKQFCENISQKKMVKHKVFGVGEVVSQDFDHITVRFGVRELMLSLKAMYERELLEIL